MENDIYVLGAKARLEVAWKIENVPQFVELLGEGRGDRVMDVCVITCRLGRQFWTVMELLHSQSVRACLTKRSTITHHSERRDEEGGKI